jgi:hypothetical protein
MKTLGLLLALAGMAACKAEPKERAVAAIASAAQGAAIEPIPLAQATATGAGATSGATYRVIGVAEDDVLNVRQEPDPSSKKLFSFAPGAKNIAGTGPRADKAGTPWVEVKFDGGPGWVNRFFLSETKPNGGCNDPELTAVIRAFMRAIAAADGAALKAVVSPLRGLDVRPEGLVLKFPYATVDTIFSSPTVLNLGPGDGGGPDITGTFKAQLTPSLQQAIGGKGAKETCGKLTTGSSSSLPPSLEQYAGVTPVSFYFPSRDGQNDWVTWVGSIEYVDGKPYFSALDRFHWEI